jgi:hypothetical protein
MLRNEANCKEGLARARLPGLRSIRGALTAPCLNEVTHRRINPINPFDST